MVTSKTASSSSICPTRRSSTTTAASACCSSGCTVWEGGGGNSSDAHPERVLVLQNLYGYEPPRAWPPLPQLPAAGISLNQNDASVMASTMVVRRLQPADLQQRLLRFCEARDSSGSLVRREAEAVAE